MCSSRMDPQRSTSQLMAWLLEPAASCSICPLFRPVDADFVPHVQDQEMSRRKEGGDALYHTRRLCSLRTSPVGSSAAEVSWGVPAAADSQTHDRPGRGAAGGYLGEGRRHRPHCRTGGTTLRLYHAHLPGPAHPMTTCRSLSVSFLLISLLLSPQ